MNFVENSSNNNSHVNNVDFSLCEIFQALTEVGINPSLGPDLIHNCNNYCTAVNLSKFSKI